MKVLQSLKGATQRRVVEGFVAVAVLGWMGAGCGPSGEPPEALSAEQIPGAVQEAFPDGGDEEVQQAVRAVLAAVAAGDDAPAYVLLQGLLERRDLTPEQRETATRAMVTVAQRMRASAESGDESANRVMKRLEANK